MTRRVLVPVIVAAGVVLILVGLGWKWLFPPKSYWSQEQARQYLDAYTKLHAMQDGQEHGPAKGTSKETSKAASKAAPDAASNKDTASLAEVRQRYESLKSQLERARTARDRTGIYLAAAGTAIVVIGILIFVKSPAPVPNTPDERRH
jgi:hypothetical protein